MFPDDINLEEELMIMWNESMTTGVSEIDVQHKELLGKFNELYEALTAGKGREETGKMLDFLQFYAQWHFEREERCMDHYQCPVAMANKEAHRNFLKRFGELYERYQESDIDPAVVLNTFVELQDWIINHIMRIDTQLNPCVAGQTNRSTS
jgi:hemerythrin